jgi:hypothetical protein
MWFKTPDTSNCSYLLQWNREITHIELSDSFIVASGEKSVFVEELDACGSHAVVSLVAVNEFTGLDIPIF